MVNWHHSAKLIQLPSPCVLSISLTMQCSYQDSQFQRH
ncbi:hypothetical protein PCIT_a4311 [Pseudoalteromonas citrea]|uniref:Uncharacterized protein n=1 Tax=Pseudoalteromonas citrea TaxID=43655 RepID=A0AAD4FRZ0_9GAMM|nr:hypothetical protein PCIT_a4311 [Pseudoalteromonas citrea]